MSDDKRYRQVELRAEQARLMCWVEERADVIVGTVITLKEIPKVRWTVHYLYEPAHVGSPRRTWRVGGVHDR